MSRVTLPISLLPLVVAAAQATTLIQFDNSTYSLINTVYFDYATHKNSDKLDPGTSGFYAEASQHPNWQLLFPNQTTGASLLQFNGFFGSAGTLEHAWLTLSQSGAVMNPEWDLIGTQTILDFDDSGFAFDVETSYFVVTAGTGPGAVTVDLGPGKIDLLTLPGFASIIEAGGGVTVAWFEEFRYYELPKVKGNEVATCSGGPDHCNGLTDTWWSHNSGNSGILNGSLEYDTTTGVPEPGAIGLLLAGALTLGGLRLRPNR